MTTTAMKKRPQRHYLLLAGLCIGVGLPAGGFFTLHKITDNPYFQPLGITKEKLASVAGTSQYTSIEILVNWGVDRKSGLSKQDLRAALSGAFKNRTDNFIFRFRDVAGEQISVTYVVGPNRYGPYAPGRLIDGINPALVALDMTLKSR